MALKIYLAGPDVFLPDFGASVFARKKALCEAYGCQGLSPLDNDTALDGLQPFDQGMAIYRANTAIMTRCDAVIAHMTPFRGVGMDSGTAFEMGYMRALGKPVLGYTNVTETFASRTQRYYEAGIFERVDPWTAGTAIERFEMADNLMMVGAVKDSGFEVVATLVDSGQELSDTAGFETCLRLLTQRS